MNWISKLRPPADQPIVSRREVPENLWDKCDECGTMLCHRELAQNLNVCTNCGHHMPIRPRDRFAALFDGGRVHGGQGARARGRPAPLRDQKKYVDRLKEARKATGEKEAMLVAEGEVGRTPVVACAQDFSSSRAP
jgi:acetyl-CoA carboxylase carboxyl transferase subunit beta